MVDTANPPANSTSEPQEAREFRAGNRQAQRVELAATQPPESGPATRCHPCSKSQTTPAYSPPETARTNPWRSPTCWAQRLARPENAGLRCTCAAGDAQKSGRAPCRPANQPRSAERIPAMPESVKDQNPQPAPASARAGNLGSFARNARATPPHPENRPHVGDAVFLPALTLCAQSASAKYHCARRGK